MAQQLPHIDVNKKGVVVDPNGVPYYKWPPFPDPPDGVNIIPFSEFKPSGIQISFGDSAEVDGLGIPTVRLAVIHDNDAPPKKKKKTKMNSAGEEIRQKSVWWEEWAEGEEQRILSIRTYDPMLHMKERVAHAVDDFKRLHDWEPESMRLIEWYGKLLYFLGLNDVNLRPRFRRNRDEDQQEEEEEDEDIDDADTSPQNRPEPAPLKVEKFNEDKHGFRQNTLNSEQEERFRQKLERVREALELRLDAFVDNPHLATKVFFSAYFRDSGMMWERMALRDCPRIVEFFLNYLLQTRALHEEETSLRRALEVARKAIEELPLTTKIGVNMPDELALCLRVIYGSRLKQYSWPDELESSVADVEFKTHVEQSGGMVISDLLPAPPPASVNNTTATDTSELSQAEEITGGWSSLGVDTGGWGAEEPKDGEGDGNPWAQTTKTMNSWGELEVHNLMTLLGPTTLPVTHTIGYVEESTRYIASVTLPETNDKLSKKDNALTFSDLFRSFAQVVLKPYLSFAAPSAPRAAIQPPELIEDPWAGVSPNSTEKPYIPRHNPQKDSITMLIDPNVGKDLALGKRMGLGGTFVQVVPKYDTPTSGSSATAENGADGITFWYAEKILQIIPSFWTEKTL